MSNAAVINATSTSGQTAGTPISIETGGDVVLKAYGTGSGNWFVVMAFAPVVNGVTGAPVTLTIDYNQPGRQTSAVGTSATEWVGWVLDQGGTWEASGIVEGYQPGEALSDDLGTFASVNALPRYGVKSGARASVNGTQYTYGGAGVGWVDAGGTTGSPKSPADIPSVLCWYDAASLALSDGAAVSSIADSSGKNGAAVQATGAAQPIYSAGGFNNSACMVFDGTKLLTFTEISAVKTLICVCQFDDPQINDYAPIIGSASAYDFAGPAKTQPYLVDRATVPSAKLPSSIRVNGISGTSVAVLSRPISPSVVTIRLPDGKSAGIGNIAKDRVGSRNFAGRYASICAFSKSLSDDDCLAVERYLASRYNITMAIKPRYSARANDIFWGDSLTVGQGATLPYPTQLATALGGTDKITIENLGASGTTAAQWNNAYAGQYMENFNFKRQCLCADMVIHVWLGTNDLFYSTTPANTYSALKSLWARAQAYGAKVIAYTILPRSNSGTPEGFEAARQSLNTLIRSESWRYDYLVDVGADATIGAAGANTDATYYSDLVHLTNAGLLIVANLTAPAFASLKL